MTDLWKKILNFLNLRYTANLLKNEGQVENFNDLYDSTLIDLAYV